MPIATSHATVSLQSLITNPSVMNIPGDADDYESASPASYRRKPAYTYRSRFSDEEEEPRDDYHPHPLMEHHHPHPVHRKRKYDAAPSPPQHHALATMLGPVTAPRRSFLEFAIKPQWTTYDEEDDEPEMDDSQQPHHSDSASYYHDAPSPSSQKRTAWGRPRGRRTIQDKIAEQNARAAEIEQELRAVGVPAVPSPGQPSPSLARLGKPGSGSARKKTVAVSVIRRSPAVGLPLSARSSASSALSDDGSVSVKYTPPTFITEPSLPAATAPAAYYPRMMLVPGMMVRVERPGGEPLYIPHSLDPSVYKHHANDVVSHSRSHAYPRLSGLPASPAASISPEPAGSDPGRPLREERLSTKLKRIQAKAGAPAEESPRGFLSQKIETLKRRESSLQQEFEEVINTPIGPHGISSAQELLQERYDDDVEINNHHNGRVLYHMLNAPAVDAERAWKKKRRGL
ncbi:uncharacterized protein LOC129591048 isoform X2 [Paramacrobiotus metropolitanus]|nr:uncharacterized protein LOC129591048 isoform X2 [Paramacrobiotus metropolitanus]XP_055342534.1 uncharacterized protein LOC129591048 isoform X2 [Paramacrobiotus metropolitanus]XP_055342535.1 uncharacterized protein LOC129591048 isoform X2 [Paramacrobiotus metropolitanus]XP_055342536.1 uncharacterized protein LOC129591048 isoform X2 [Paramacrobiotus metropolitanus]XP_055342537.1 uncharacterized protein LOC129591048 isoform X2 [Paramacrobiotus metropolitanus]XP_055342538.1 uncharacterized prot